MPAAAARLIAGALAAVRGVHRRNARGASSLRLGDTSTSPSAITRLANGELPAGCPAGIDARTQTVAFVAGGNAWAQIEAWDI